MTRQAEEVKNKKREQEQKQALDIELNLREHCSKAHEAYERMVE